MRVSSRLRLALLGVVALASAGLTVVGAGPVSAATSATVSINAGQVQAALPANGVGMNVAIWDGRLNGADTTGLLRNAGITAVRYPGGGYGDGYHWQTHT